MRLKASFKHVILIALLSCSVNASDFEGHPSYEADTPFIEQVRAKRKAEFKEAKVKTHEEFVAYLDNNPDKLPHFRSMFDVERESFINSLVFTEYGLAGFYVMDIVRYLPEEELDELMGLFNAKYHLPALLKHLPPQKKSAKQSDHRLNGIDSVSAELFATWRNHRCISRGCQAHYGTTCDPGTCGGDGTCPYPLSCSVP